MTDTAQKMFNYLGETKVNIQGLIKNYPPKYTNEKKLKAYNDAQKVHGKKDGEITITRVNFDTSKVYLPLEKKNYSCSVVSGFYDYPKSFSSETKKVWYVNFADPMLFGYYAGSAFAQDEIQTLEMPLLASCMHYLDDKKIPGLESKTIELRASLYESEPDIFIERKRLFPTPYLLENVPYWISIKTNPILPNGKKENI